jgi:hypothetical protein
MIQAGVARIIRQRQALGGLSVTLSDHDVVELARAISAELALEYKIAEDVRQNREARRYAQQRAEAAMDDLDEKLAVIQANCPHSRVTPITGWGELADYRECELCGARGVKPVF